MESNLNIPLKRRFFANACHVCRAYGNDIKLKRCSKCKMIAYCSREHQVSHWPEHKILCGFLCERIRNGKVYNMPSNPENVEAAWCKARKETLFGLQTLMSIQMAHSIQPFEFEMLSFPRSCEICHETDLRKLKDCTDCPDASFCHEHPKDDGHLAKCAASKCMFGMHGLSLHFRDTQLPMDYGTKIPRNMDEAIKMFKADSYFENDELEKTWDTLFSDLITRPYTFFYALRKLPSPRLNKLLIHIIGSTNCDMDSADYWHFLLHHNDSLKELKIIFVGTHLPNSSLELKPCGECSRHNRWISIQSVKGYYVNFAADRSFKKPDYIVRFNMEIHTWMGSLPRTVKLLARLARPIIMTSSNAEQSRDHENQINEVLGKQLTALYAGPNPFTGRTTFKEFQSKGHYYSNHYLTIYEKFS